MNNRAIDARSQFRLNGMDLERPEPASSQPAEHWILTRPALRAWIGDLEKAFQRLVDAGFQPFEGEPVTPEAVIDALGFWNEPQPTGFVTHAKFTARMLAATTREGLRIERERAWLRQQGAPVQSGALRCQR